MNTVRIFAKLDYVSRDGTVPLYLRLTTNRRVHPPLHLGHRVRPIDWDPDACKVRATAALAEKINLMLSRTITRAQEVLLDHEITGRTLTYESFIKEFSGLSPYNFYDVAGDYQRMNRGIFSDEYQEKVGHITKKLKEFAPRLELHEIDYNFIRAYTQHLATVRMNSKNTIHSNLRIIRRILGVAVKQELIKKNPFEGYALEKSKTTKEILSIEEIKILEALLKEKEFPYYLRKALAWFLLAVYSGRRYQDLQDFKNWKFYKDHIKLIQQKRVRGRDERKEMILHLNKKLRAIIKDIRAHGYEPLTNAQANKFIKEVTGRAGIDKNISFHCARHTFAAINKKLTQDLTVRRDLLGQDSINSTLIYDQADQGLLSGIMKKWDAL